MTLQAPSEEFEAHILEHYGVKGMRWGVRKAVRETTSERARGRAELQRAVGLKKTAAKTHAHAERIARGEATTRDILKEVGHFRFTDVIPRKK